MTVISTHLKENINIKYSSKINSKNFNDSCDVFAGAPAAAAGTGGDGNAGEDDQAASVSGYQPEPQAPVRSSDQAQPQSPQEFSGEQVARQ